MRVYEDDDLKKIQQLELMILKEFVALCEENDLEYFAVGGTSLGIKRHGGFIPWDDDIDIGMPRKDYIRFLEIAKEKLSYKYWIINSETYKDYPLQTTQLALKNTKFVHEPFKKLNIPFGIYLDIFPFDNVLNINKSTMKNQKIAWLLGKIKILRNISKPYVPYSGIKKDIIYLGTFLVHVFLKIVIRRQDKLDAMISQYCLKYLHVETNAINYICDTNYYRATFNKEELYPLKSMKFEDMEIKVPNKVEVHLKRLYKNYMELPPIEKRKNHYPYILDFGDYGD